MYLRMVSVDSRCMGKERSYIAIDLKSFYASVECMERGLDPLTALLVVADSSRTEKTICLAVSPALKAYGISGRARLFEAIQKVKEVNALRQKKAPGHVFSGNSTDDRELKADPKLSLNFLIATPQMARYMEISTRIYQVYLRFIAPEDIHVYSIDEVFIDATAYLDTYHLSPRDLAMKLIREVLKETGITATAGIGTNLYLAKIAMDVMAKRMPADKDGVRIASLDEMDYRRELWDHRPLTDFWRVGRGYQKKLEAVGLMTMGDIARCSLGKTGEFYNEDLLYKLFGINAELLIDHAWGWEPCTIRDIKSYAPETNSISQGQVLTEPYSFDKARIVVREMADALSMDLVAKGLVTSQLVLTVGYDIENLTDPERAKNYKGPVTEDHYGRKVPKHAHGTEHLKYVTSGASVIGDAFCRLFDRAVDPELLIRRMYVVAADVVPEGSVPVSSCRENSQLDLFTDYAAQERKEAEEIHRLEREHSAQEAMLQVKLKYGKNAMIKGTSLQEGATGMTRNRQIGGHRA